MHTDLLVFTCIMVCPGWLQSSVGNDQHELWESEEARQKIWIIDTFPYNGEMVAELRLKHLFSDVDEFIVVESRVTHSGKQKDFLYVERDWKSFEPYLSKVRACVPR